MNESYTPVDEWSERVKAGDVVVSDRLQYASYAEHDPLKRGDRPRILAGTRRPGPSYVTLVETKTVVVDGEKYKRRSERKEDCSADDPTRKDALFLVVDAYKEPDSVSHVRGYADSYPGGYIVKLKRLAADGTYDPDGEELETCQNQAYNYGVGKLHVVGKWPTVEIPVTTKRIPDIPLRRTEEQP